MKFSLAKKWKLKQQKFNRKYSATVKNRFKRKRDLNGKFVLLLSKKNKKCGAILKFTSRKLCRALWAVNVNSAMMRQVSRKFVISPKRNKKVLRGVEVIISAKFKEDFLKVWTKSHEKKAFKPLKKNDEITEILPKVTPIKILSCKDCNIKFTSRELFDKHTHSHLDLDLSSGSEQDMVIDDDVELVLDHDFESSEQLPGNFLNLKEEPKVDEFCCMLNSCGKIFDHEEALNKHISIQHESFPRESLLVSHQQIVHPVDALQVQVPKKDPHFFTMSPPIPSTSETLKRKSSSTKNTIKFKRFDSKKNFVCRICSVSLDQRLHLDRHITVHHISKVYFCYKCHHSYYQLHLLNHLKTAHLKSMHETGYIKTISDMESVASFRCAFCQFTAKQRNRVIIHMTNEHYEVFEKGDEEEQEHASSPDSLEELFNVEIVESVNNKQDEDNLLVEVQAKKKLQETKKRKPPNDPSFKFRCARCQRRFSRKRNLRTHACERGEVYNGSPSEFDSIPKKSPAKLQMLNGFYNCSFCPQVFTDKSMFNRHVNATHSAAKISSSSGFTSGYSS